MFGRRIVLRAREILRTRGRLRFQRKFHQGREEHASRRADALRGAHRSRAFRDRRGQPRTGRDPRNRRQGEFLRGRRLQDRGSASREGEQRLRLRWRDHVESALPVAGPRRVPQRIERHRQPGGRRGPGHPLQLADRIHPPRQVARWVPRPGHERRDPLEGRAAIHHGRERFPQDPRGGNATRDPRARSQVPVHRQRGHRMAKAKLRERFVVSP
mmetsp:Transcript_7394/g.18094  ORF Transcript_7394/g.18094 Transcript_7394/m.18094 type:complete len:214 (+) Transcript_7394:2406-3047(+)